MTITQRLSLVISLLSASLVISVIAGILIVTGFQSRFQYVEENTVPSIIEVGNLVEGSNQLIIWMYRHQSATNLARQNEVEIKIDEKIQEVESRVKYYLNNYISNDADRLLSEEALATIKEIKKKLPVFIKGSREQNDAVALTQLQGSNGVGQDARTLITTAQKQLKLNVDIAQSFQKSNAQIYSMTLWMMTLGSAAVILVLCTFAVRQIINIRRSLKNMSFTMDNASSRLDLTLRADDSQKDEIGQTAKAFNQLMDKIAATLLTVSHSSQSVSTASAQISAGNEDLSSRTEEQAASLEQTASSMSQLSETVRQTAENTGAASKLSQNALHISDQNSDRVRTMLGTMSDIKSSSAKVTEIISLIESISFQTNILALNAAVEAARAGEQGRGFAVVAGEVRNLAQRSSSSAREIRQLIESSMHFVEAGVSQAEDVGKNMGNMNDAIRQVSDLVNEIAAATHEQTQGIGQVLQAVNQMDDVTQQNAALVEEASAASHSLMEQATTLNQLVATFVIDADGRTVISPAAGADISTGAPRLTAKNIKVSETENWQSF